ncbi:MAG: 2-C-methyl-D-erythritol 4-phosphate cytidylyltransferase [Muribaculaceae bacterium]|nr:2-C-methyl-D-erythritol 4-phosphate cytidylyltransferase [Muribaculaceae bacterium]
MKKYAIIVAGGEGNRAGGVVPKQFQLIHGIPMLWWSVRAFHTEDPFTKIIIVLHPGYFDYWDTLYAELPAADKEIDIHISCGGRSRLETVRNGLMSVDEGEDSYVAVHDAARPLVTPELISRGWAKMSECEAAIPVVAMTSSLRKLESDGSVAVPRKDYVEVQTPQIFKSDLLKKAYEAPLTQDMTDDASVAEAIGINVSLFEGWTYNIKVTNNFDIKIAELLMTARD